MQTLALAVLHVIRPQVGLLLVVAGVIGLLTQSGMPITSGLLVAAVALLGTLAVGLACTLPLLPPHSRRTPDARKASHV